jgi:hypothetical protein
MKSSKLFFLLIGMMISCTADAIMVGGYGNRDVDLEQYLFGDTDKNGQTILHRIAANCDNDNFAVRFKPFGIAESLESESAQRLQAKIIMYNMLPTDIASVMLLQEVYEFAQKRDNNGETALDIVRQRNASNPHQRCAACIELLEKLAEFNKTLHEETNVAAGN